MSQGGWWRQLDRIVESGTFAPAKDPVGRAWIAELPHLVERVCRQWNLTLDGDALYHGYNALVFLVERDSIPLALKLIWPEAGAAEEARALEMWQGRGMVRLVDSDAGLGALLLERLDPSRSLLSLEAAEAATAAGVLVRRLAIPPPPGARSLRDLIGDTARAMVECQERLGHPVAENWFGEAVRLSKHFHRHAGTDVLIHGDLHHGNILAGSREPWLAIDPRPIAGELEACVSPLMWTRDGWLESGEQIRNMLAAVCAAGGLDPERTRQWVLVRCVDYLLWGLDHGLTEDPKRCRRILGAIV